MVKRHFTAKHKQRGATLLVSLALLLVLTILALAAARNATLQQRMASNLQQQNLAFQAAESGIQAAILQLEKPQNRPEFGRPKYLFSKTVAVVSWSDSAIDCASTKLDYHYCVEVALADCHNSGAGGFSGVFSDPIGSLDFATCYTITSSGRYGSAKAVHQQGYMF